MSAYYNEFDPFAAQWLRNLISAGHLPAGDVDDRSIVDVRPDDLAGYTQVHFFAGIGGWGHALRLAGWPDERPIWTGSCPCQPFSNAGKGAGTDDPRHLWPHFMDLIAARRPPVVMGEQVAGSAGYGWLDGVRADLAGQGYASRGVDIPACAVDAPHIRQRLYWIAVADDAGGRARHVGPGEGTAEGGRGRPGQGAGPHGGGVADADAGRCPGRPEDAQRGAVERAAAERTDDLVNATSVGRGEGRSKHELRGGRPAAAGADAQRTQRGVALGDAYSSGLAVGPQPEDGQRDVREEGSAAVPADHGHGGCALADTNEPVGGVGDEQPAGQLAGSESDAGDDLWAGPRNERPDTFWSRADRLLCHDGKTRRAQPGVPLLVNGVRGRVAFGLASGQPDHQEADRPLNRIGVWKGAGNEIVPQEAEQVIRAYMDIAP